MVTFCKLRMPDTLSWACATQRSPAGAHVVARPALVVLIMNAGHASAKAIRVFEEPHLLFTGLGGRTPGRGPHSRVCGERGERKRGPGPLFQAEGAVPRFEGPVLIG